MPMPGKLMGGDAMKENRSMFNPTDVASMKQDVAGMGGMGPDTTIRNYLGTMGIDVDGPVTQLTDFAKKQTDNADPLKKMQNMAGKPSMGPAEPAPEGGGMDALLNM